jgi:alkyl hydroperoxide reductase subunit AhpC
MKTVGEKLEKFLIVGVPPGQPVSNHAFFNVDDTSFPGMWKIIVFYPKDFTQVCPTEIIAYDKLYEEFEKRNAILLTGSTDNEFCKVAWQKSHDELKKIRHFQFADIARDHNSLSNQLGIFSQENGSAHRATFIIDPRNVIQHVTVNNMNIGRNADETLRVLDAIQTGQQCACNRAVGGDTL